MQKNVLPDNFEEKLNMVKVISKWLDSIICEIKFDANESWHVSCFTGENRNLIDGSITLYWDEKMNIRGDWSIKKSFSYSFRFEKIFNNENFYALICEGKIQNYFYKDASGSYNLIRNLDKVNITYSDMENIKESIKKIK